MYFVRSAVLDICFLYIWDVYSTGWYAGAIISKLHDETPCCFNLGCRGMCCCLATIPLHFGSPLGGLSMFVCLSCYLRQKVVEKYNVEETETCFCGPCNSCCLPLHIHCNYPCSFYQMLMSIRKWEEKPVVVVGNPVATPIRM